MELCKLCGLASSSKLYCPVSSLSSNQSQSSPWSLHGQSLCGMQSYMQHIIAHHWSNLLQNVTLILWYFFRFSGTQNSDFVYFLYKLLDQNQPQNNVLKYLVTIVIDCHIQGKFRINSDTFLTNWINTLMQELP